MLSFFKEYRDSQRLIAQSYDVVFYSENAYYFQYLRHLFEAFAGRQGLRVAYITSDKKDPLLQRQVPGLDTWYIGNTLLFVWPRLRSKVLVSTMPGIGEHGYKRSPTVGRYVYVFHALVSTHQQYRAGAFRHYDAIFCCGPDHEAEVRKTDAREGRSPRDTVAYGYPLLEELRARAVANTNAEGILLAPSWHPEGILNTCLQPLLAQLLQLGMPVWVRPHPEFAKRNPKAMKELEALAANNAQLAIDRSPEVFTRLAAAALLVTDRSGIALEYAFAHRRPVLFIDTSPKIYNPLFGELGMTPVEDRLRPLIGRSVVPGEIEKAASVAARLLSEAASYAPALERLEAETVYGPAYWAKGISYIESCLS